MLGVGSGIGFGWTLEKILAQPWMTYGYWWSRVTIRPIAQLAAGPVSSVQNYGQGIETNGRLGDRLATKKRMHI